MRLIDADALIGKFNAKYKANGSISKGTFAKIVNEVPTIESPRGWTPCADGMPTESGRYVVTVKRTVLEKETEFTSERDFYANLSAGYRWESTGFVDENIIAWMPKFKPAPYRADDTTGKVKEDADNGEWVTLCPDCQ